MSIASTVYVLHAWPVFGVCVPLVLAGELVMVGDHSITLSETECFLEKLWGLVSSLRPWGICGWRTGKKAL